MTVALLVVVVLGFFVLCAIQRSVQELVTAQRAQTALLYRIAQKNDPNLDLSLAALSMKARQRRAVKES